MAEKGNPNSVSDAGVGALCARTAVHGAYLNVMINCKDFDGDQHVAQAVAEANDLLSQAKKAESNILEIVEKLIV